MYMKLTHINIAIMLMLLFAAKTGKLLPSEARHFLQSISLDTFSLTILTV